MKKLDGIKQALRSSQLGDNNIHYISLNSGMEGVDRELQGVTI
jgi:hypothetical protein